MAVFSRRIQTKLLAGGLCVGAVAFSTRSGGIGQPPARPDLRIQWESTAHAEAYEVEIAATRRFTRVLHREVTKTSHFTWPWKKPGRYFIRVAGLNGSGVRGAFSKPSPVLVKYSGPMKNRKIKENNDETNDPPQRRNPALAFAKHAAPKGSRNGSDAASALLPHPKPAPNRAEPAAKSPGRPPKEPPPRKREDTGPDRVALATPSPAMEVEESSGRPRDKELLLRVGLAPARYSYRSGGTSPGAKVDATLFNSFLIGARWTTPERRFVESTYTRSGTVLFGKSERLEDGQKQPRVLLRRSRLSLLAGTDLPYTKGIVQVSAGAQSHLVPVLYREQEGLTRATHTRMRGPSVGLSLSSAPSPFWGTWRFSAAFDAFPFGESADVKRYFHWAARLAWSRRIAAGFFAGLGLRHEESRFRIAVAEAEAPLSIDETKSSMALFIGREF